VLDDWLDESQTARELGKTVRTLRQWRRQGKGPPYALFGRTVRYNRAALVEFYRSKQVMPVRTRKGRDRS
jgi:hypothetical protein